MSIDGTTEFRSVESTFGTTDDVGVNTISALKVIAQQAKAMVLQGVEGVDNPSATSEITYLSAGSMSTESGSSVITAPAEPSEPNSNDAAIYQTANDYLDWLSAQALASSPSITYDEEDEPVAPAVDTTMPALFDIQSIPMPEYVPPEWDESAGWTYDLESDETIAPLVAPFVWSEYLYASQLLNGNTNVLYDAVKADIEDATHGLDALDEGRLWDRARERENRINAAAVDSATRLFSAGGFAMPTGAAQAALDRVNSEARDKLAAISREIMVQKSALYLEAKKLAIANGLEVEKTTMDFYHKEADFLLRKITQEITSTVQVSTFNIERIRMYIDKYKGYADAFASEVAGKKGIVEAYTAQVQAEQSKADANKSIIEQLIAKNKALVDVYLAQLQGFQVIMDSRVKHNNVLADIYKTQVGQINSYTDATKMSYDLVDKQQKNLVDFRVGKYNAQVSEAKRKLDEILGFLSVKVDQLKSQVQAATATAVAALSGMNANLSLSVSGAAGISGSESHQYDETKGQDAGTTHSESRTWDETKSDRTYHEEHYYDET